MSTTQLFLVRILAPVLAPDCTVHYQLYLKANYSDMERTTTDC